MPKNRLDMHELLCSILGSDNVYYQPPESIKMRYPCILYNHVDQSIEHADDLPYKIDSVYMVTYISRDPDSEVPSEIEKLRSCRFDRHYVADNLHHYVYKVRYIEN